jgi:hypothetical protein
MPRAKIAKNQPKMPSFSRREKALAVLGRLVGVKLEKTTPVQPTFVFEPEPQIRYPVYDYINLFEVATTSWPLRRAFRAIIQECIRNRWTIKPAFKWKCDKCGKTYDHTPNENQLKEGEKPKCEANGCGAELRQPSEDQARILERLLKRPNGDYHFDDFVKSSIFYDLSLDDWYWGMSFKRVPKTEGGKVVVQEKKVVYEKVPKEIFVEDARFIFPVADEFGHLGGYEWFCSECYDKQPGDQPVVAIRQDMSLADRQKAIICPLCGEVMEQTAYVQEIGGMVTARFTKNELIHGSSSRVAPALFGNSKIVSVWKLVQTVLAMDDYNWEVYSTGKVGSIIGFPGEDQLEVDEKKKAIEEEIKALDAKDIQSGRYKSSKKIRTLMLGLKKDQQPIRIPIMEDMKAMQSIEFYRLYMEAIAGIYGVTPEFVSTTDVAGGGIKLKIDVQNRTTQEHQAGFADLFNDDLLPKFGITDWLFIFNPIEGRDQLRDSQTEHTKAATAMTWAQAGFNVSLGPGRELIVTGKANIPRVQEPSRAGEAPRFMEGKPEFWQGGEPTRTGGERLELGEKPTVEGMGEGEVRLPISWYSASQIRIWDRVYALNNDKDEVYVVVNNHEVQGTRTSATNLNYAVAYLLDNVLEYISSKLAGKVGFNEDDFKSGQKKIVTGFRRKFEPELLINLASYLDSIGMEALGEKIDSLRMRLEQIKPKKLEIQGEPSTETASGEMLEPIFEQKSILQARAPFGVSWQEETLFKAFKSIIKWAQDEVKKGKNKEKVTHEALIKAQHTLDSSYEELVKRAIEHAKKRTKKIVNLSPDELRRINAYKENSLNDFDRILRDSLKETKKNDGENIE